MLRLVPRTRVVRPLRLVPLARRFAIAGVLGSALIVSSTSVALADEKDAAFQKLDADGDGFISQAEASKDDRIGQGFAQFDLNKDARIDRIEFAAIQQTTPSKPEPTPPGSQTP